MANIIDRLELDGLREDFDNFLGIHQVGGDTEPSFEQAKTLVTISRYLDRGTFNPTTKKYEDPNVEVIYTGPAHISPVTYRRDRQEIGGGESVRIRQYRGVVPWDAGDIHIDDEITINFSEDPNVEGRTFDITDVLYESLVSMRRFSFVDTSKDSRGSGGDC